MNSSSNDPIRQNTINGDPAARADQTAHPVDATLQLIATLPVPEGLEDRIHARLRSAPRSGRLLFWPPAIESGWMRSAAAAAIAVIVAGGGWSVYSHVQSPQPAKVIMMPAPGPASGGFSSAGAMRTPTTLNAPVLKHPQKKSTVKVKKAKTAVTSSSAQTDATARPTTPNTAAAK